MHIKQRASVNVMFNIMSCGCVNLSNQCLNNSLHAIYVYINAFNRGRIATVSLCGVFFAQLFTLHSAFGQSQTFQILTKYIGKTIHNYETKYMQYENIFYNNSNDGYFIL
jgi:hypothetical protein